MKLDKTKDYGIAFIGDKTFFGQNGKLFDMNTLEEVAPPKPPPTTFKCNSCGFVTADEKAMVKHVGEAHGEAKGKRKGRKT
jgi:hypothetical protein